MAISIRGQILTAAFALFVPVAWLMYLASGATYAEQQQYLSDEARALASVIAIRLVSDRDVSTVATAVGEMLAVLPRESRVLVEDAEGRTLGGEAPLDLRVYCHGAASIANGHGTVTVYLPEALAWNRTWPIYRRNYVVVVGVTLTVVAIVFLLSWRWRRGLRALELHASRIGAGDRADSPLPRMPSSEMVSLQQSFTEMERNLVSLERQVVRQERLAAIGTLMSGIAHELNNPLQAIAGRAQLVVRDSSLGEASRADLELIEKESARASAIIRNLSRFGRQADVPPEPVRLTDVITAVVELRDRRLDELGIHLVVDDIATGRFMGVLTECQQVLLNFVVNAEQAMASMKRGTRQLTIRTRDLAGRVYCEVEDTGPGVSPGDESKLFQPFFTTKPVGEGTGLGLSVSQSIIESYGGRIGYRRADSGGAIMWFDAPAI